MNEFAQVEEEECQLQVDDLVTMTIVDVFETDNNGRLLSYCPTFDNRDIRKTTQATETLRKSSTKIMSQWSVIANSQAASRFNEGLNKAAKMGMSAAKSMATQVKHAVDERMASSPQRPNGGSSHLNGASIDAHGFEIALSEAEEATSATGHNDDTLASLQRRSDTYVSEASGDEPRR
jgi:hypothetical protein